MSYIAENVVLHLAVSIFLSPFFFLREDHYLNNYCGISNAQLSETGLIYLLLRTFQRTLSPPRKLSITRRVLRGNVLVKTEKRLFLSIYFLPNLSIFRVLPELANQYFDCK